MEVVPRDAVYATSTPDVARRDCRIRVSTKCQAQRYVIMQGRISHDLLAQRLCAVQTLSGHLIRSCPFILSANGVRGRRHSSTKGSGPDCQSVYQAPTACTTKRRSRSDAPSDPTGTAVAQESHCELRQAKTSATSAPAITPVNNPTVKVQNTKYATTRMKRPTHDGIGLLFTQPGTGRSEIRLAIEDEVGSETIDI
jgi:hypothetical protein